jgi:hypothetical protein
MAQAETSQFTSAAPQSIPGAIIDIVVTIVRAFMGSLLGISTAAFFGVFGLVAFAACSLDVAITSVGTRHERDAAEPRGPGQPGPPRRRLIFDWVGHRAHTLSMIFSPNRPCGLKTRKTSAST